MGRAPCCDKANVKRGPWSPEEDAKLKEYIDKYGTGGNWIALPQKAGLRRCGKSCRLRWLNYLRPNIKHGEFSDDEDRIICNLFANIGSRWSIIAAQLPGRTDNDIKNYWNTKLKKKLMGLVPSSHKRPHHHQSTTYHSISLLHTPPPPPPPPPPPTSFTGYEKTLSIPSTLFNTTCSSNAGLQITQDGYVGPMPNDQVNGSFLMFGGEASCSSSDGSSNKEVEYDAAYRVHMSLQSCTLNGFDENGNSMLSNGGNVDKFSEKPNGFYGESPLEYSLEEIKQLISTNICSNNLNFFVDEEDKREEKVMFY